MNLRSSVFGLSSLILLAACSSAPERPADNVSPRRHPNIAEAQRLVTAAFDRISDAQQANEYDMGGHAARAKELLVQANDELKLAAVDANRR